MLHQCHQVWKEERVRGRSVLRDIHVVGHQTVRRLSRSQYLVCKYLRVVVLKWEAGVRRNLKYEGFSWFKVKDEEGRRI